MSTTCRKCGQPLRFSGIGRPPTYCSVGCRRAAEYEVRRASRRLESLETQRDELLQALTEPNLSDYSEAALRGRLAAVHDAIQRYEARLALLLTDWGESSRPVNLEGNDR